MCKEDNFIFWREKKPGERRNSEFEQLFPFPILCVYVCVCLLNNILDRVQTSTAELKQKVKATGNQWESHLNAVIQE